MNFMLVFLDVLFLDAKKRAETLDWVLWIGQIRATLESQFTHIVFFILVKIDKDKRLVVLDEELEVCLIS